MFAFLYFLPCIGAYIYYYETKIKNAAIPFIPTFGVGFEDEMDIVQDFV